MKSFLYILLALTCSLTAACAVQRPPIVSLQPEKYPLLPLQHVVVDANSGVVEITSAEGSSVELLGSISSPQYVDYSTAIEVDGLHIHAAYRGNLFIAPYPSPIKLELQVPAGIAVSLQTDEAAVNIHDYSGQVKVSSVSGEVRLMNASGQFVLNSNRGDIKVQNCSGDIQLIGNYGMLNMLDSHGLLSASTIVGTVTYSGSLQAGDAIHLETDRGPVQIQLGQASDVSVHINTTSGELYCTIPGITYEGRNCSGVLQAGRGKLTVRTVSGPVTLEQLP